MNEKELYAFIKEFLHYNPDTGVFTWLKSNSNNTKVGQVTGYNEAGYLRIGVNKKLYRAHRLAWLYYYGEMPKDCIDHINGITTDNRICNLRACTHAENMQNKKSAKKDSTHGFLGVRKDRGKYVAIINVNKKRVYLGQFSTPQEEHEIYLKSKRELHTFNTL